MPLLYIKLINFHTDSLHNTTNSICDRIIKCIIQVIYRRNWGKYYSTSLSSKFHQSHMPQIQGSLSNEKNQKPSFNVTPAASDIKLSTYELSSDKSVSNEQGAMIIPSV